MDRKEFEEFMRAQREEILRYKWIESEKAGHDIGQRRAAQEWTDKYAKEFREEWERKRSGERDKASGDN
jgi:hypothetical protein